MCVIVLDFIVIMELSLTGVQLCSGLNEPLQMFFSYSECSSSLELIHQMFLQVLLKLLLEMLQEIKFLKAVGLVISVCLGKKGLWSAELADFEQRHQFPSNMD